MLIADGETLGPVASAWIDFLGHLHPVVLHFPLALILVGAVAVLWNWLRGEEGVGEFAFHCLWIGAAMGVVASVSGWFFAEHEAGEEGLELHRWFAIAATGASVLVAGLATLARTDERPGWVAVTRLGALLTAGLMAFAGHLGGNMVWGEDAVTKPLWAAIQASWRSSGASDSPAPAQPAKPVEAPKPAAPAPPPAKSAEPAKPEPKPAAPAPPPAKPAEPAKPEPKPAAPAPPPAKLAEPAKPEPKPAAPAPPPAKPAEPATPKAQREVMPGAVAEDVPPPVPPKEAVSFKKHLMPLLKERCFECHSGEKPKDGIGFDHMDELIKTEGKKAVVLKGDPARSTIFTTVMRADSHKKRMPPPKSGSRLTPEQAGLIQAWIKEGAKLDN
ncbi:MAG: hypothetical protein EBQ99_09785 [Planctomycetes bacterium]|nr:hypothetical protein [Planctomycetota bacterium]